MQQTNDIDVVRNRCWFECSGKEGHIAYQSQLCGRDWSDFVIKAESNVRSQMASVRRLCRSRIGVAYEDPGLHQQLVYFAPVSCKGKDKKDLNDILL